MTTGAPEHVAILPGNSWWPIATAGMLGGFFLAMLAGRYPIAPVFLLGVVRLWSDHAAGVGAVVAVLLVLPGWLA